MTRGSIESEPIDWRMVEANMGLVYLFANRAHGATYWAEDIDDLIQDGTLGLVRATQKFDPTLGHRFSTYAQHWIKAGMQKGVQHRNGLTSPARGRDHETLSLDHLMGAGEDGEGVTILDRFPAEEDTEAEALSAALIDQLDPDGEIRDLFEDKAVEVARRRMVSPQAVTQMRQRERKRLNQMRKALAS